MSVSQSSLSIDFSGLPAATVEAFRSAAAFIRERISQDQGSEAFAGFEAELMEKAFAVCRTALCDYIEARDERDGPSRRDGQVCYRMPPTRKTINTLFGQVTFSRSRYRMFPGTVVPVDDSLGLIDGYLTIPAAYRALLVVDHCTPRDAAELFRKLGGMNPSASHLQRLSATAGKLWKEKGEVALDEIRKATQAEAVSFAVSLDGVMVAMQPDEERKEACWREASHDQQQFPLRWPHVWKVRREGEITNGQAAAT